MKNYLKLFVSVLTLSLGLVSCHDDLDQSPIDPDAFTEEDVYANAQEAKSALAKLYAGYALTGQSGPAGDPDLDPNDIDEGFSQYTRMLFNLNELTTDHAVVGWGDPGLPDLHGMYWSGSNDFSEAMYFRLAQEVSFCNSFIENASLLQDDVVTDYIAEARFLRAFAYYNLIDFYANVPLQTTVTTNLPTQSNRQDLFNFVESELLDIQNLLPDSNEYGRVDKIAAWALLSKLYLNSEVWTNTPRYSDCVTFSNNVINSSYSLNTTDANNNGTAYDELFLADNNSNGAQNEFIFVTNFDGINSQTYGGTTFLVHASIGGSMIASEYGVNGGWAGLRTTKNLVNKFAVDINDLNNSLGSLSDWGLVGDATINGWDGPDMEMYQTGTNTFALYADLSAGELKFRFNEDWGNNYGDDDNNGSLDAGGSNIPVPSAGTYFVTLDLNNFTYTLDLFTSDKRGMFYTNGQNLEIEDIGTFTDGYAVTKFKNIDSNGNQGNDPNGEFVSTDLPLIRTAEIYLNYAEATLRGGAGDMNLALNLVNQIRERAYGNASGNISSGDLTLDFILDERSRELYWEGQRRTDLVRYNYFTTGAYTWPFKGNDPEGTSVGDFRNIFPIPTSILTVNSNLSQNNGY